VTVGRAPGLGARVGVGAGDVDHRRLERLEAEQLLEHLDAFGEHGEVFGEQVSQLDGSDEAVLLTSPLKKYTFKLNKMVDSNYV